MNSNFDRRISFRVPCSALLWALAAVFSVSQFSPAAFASVPKEPAPFPGKARVLSDLKRRRLGKIARQKKRQPAPRATQSRAPGKKSFDRNSSSSREINSRSEERRVGKECRSRGWPY